jgi:acetyltransferase-like isoleucine patch superfamily enzyme
MCVIGLIDVKKEEVRWLKALEEKIDTLKITDIKTENDLTLVQIVAFSDNSNSTLLQHAFTQGLACFHITQDIDLDDLTKGYLENDTVDWYAKIFPDPIVMTRPQSIRLSLGSTINPRAVILTHGLEDKPGTFTLGRASHIGSDALLNLGPAHLKIGSFTLVSANFSAHAMRHTTSHISNFAIKKGPFKFFGDIYESYADIEIGHDAWIGERVTCLPGVKVATGSVVGAGSILTKSTRPYGIYAGNPATFIRPRFKENKIELLLASNWWTLSFEKLHSKQDVFKQDIAAMPLNELKDLLEC